MTTDQNKTAAIRIVQEGINKNNLGALTELFTANYTEHQPVQPGSPTGLEGFKQWLTAFRVAFPDLHYTIDDTIAEGDKVVQRVTGNGTMTGPFAGMPATLKHASWEEIHISRFKDGKVVEHWATVDQLGMLQKLGLAPVPQQLPV
jgi:predicted ester cyclase